MTFNRRWSSQKSSGKMSLSTTHPYRTERQGLVSTIPCSWQSDHVPDSQMPIDVPSFLVVVFAPPGPQRSGLHLYFVPGLGNYSCCSPFPSQGPGFDYLALSCRLCFTLSAQALLRMQPPRGTNLESLTLSLWESFSEIYWWRTLAVQMTIPLIINNISWVLSM